MGFFGINGSIRKSLSLKFTVIMAVILLLYAAAVLAIFNSTTHADIEEVLAETIEQHAKEISDTSRSHLARGNLVDLEMMLEDAARAGHIISIEVYDVRRRILIDGDPSTQRILSAPESEPLKRAVESGEKQVLIGGDVMTLALPLLDGGQRVGAMQLAAAVAPVKSIVSDATRRNIVVAIFVFTLGLAIVFLFLEHALTPIRQLTDATKRAKDGDLSTEVEITGDDEIGVLAESYADLMRSLQASRSEIERLDLQDATTDLPNRKSLESCLKSLLDTMTGNCTDGALLAINLDHFRRINETFGHAHGDEMLRAFSARLRDRLVSAWWTPGGDGHKPLLARTAGDEFLVFLPGVDRPGTAAAIANRILKSLNKPFAIAGRTILARCSIGIVLIPDDGSDCATLIRNAGLAMRYAKDQGRNTYCFFSESMSETARSRLEIEAEMGVAIENEQFELHYQPQIDCRTGKLLGAEALVRWNHPERGRIPPNAFIPVAEQSGLIVPLGDWIIGAACRQSAIWMRQHKPLRISINLSIAQIEHRDFVRRFKTRIAETGADPRLIEIELTESLAMQERDVVVSRCAPLREMGIRIAIDDFGTGYSSLSSLTTMDFDAFKIDQSFIAELGKGKDAEAIVRLVIALAKQLDCETVAEGIETAEQYAFLREVGCDVAQGYLFGKPMAAASFEGWRANLMDDTAAMPSMREQRQPLRCVG